MASLSSAISDCGYTFTEHTLAISLPPSLSIRHFAAWHAIVERSLGSPEAPSPRAIEVKDVLKWVLGGRLLRDLNLRFSSTSDVTIQLTVTHEETSREYKSLAPDGKAVPKQGNKKAKVAHDSDSSAGAVQKALLQLSHADFLRLGLWPLKPCATPCTFNVVCSHASIFIAGRYIKYSRELSQSPWIIDGVRRTEHSVEEVIGEPLLKHFRASTWRFMSAGREDLDVRMLGSGRPFVFELQQPRPPVLTPALFAEMQREINARLPDAVQICDLQRAPKSELTIIKEGEETKTKIYRCVVWVSRPVQPGDLDVLKDIKDLELNQKTPIRVLHRRSLATRKKTIHKITAEWLAPHFLLLDLETQAGTYIKEFVHSDLGRTFPNLGSLLNCEADILQLDVLAVSLPWPPRVDHGPDAVPALQPFKNDFADMIARSRSSETPGAAASAASSDAARSACASADAAAGAAAEVAVAAEQPVLSTGLSKQ